MSNLYITNHAEDRFKERCGLPKRLVAKNAAIALERGITHAETTGALKRYYDRLYFANETANNIRVYAGKVYIFSYDTLITILNLPPNLRKTAEKILREKKKG